MGNTQDNQASDTRKAARSERPHIAVVDDDESVREALKGLLRSVGFGAEVYASAEGFLRSEGLRDTECLILDVRMPGTGGVELQRLLALVDCDIPFVEIALRVGFASRSHFTTTFRKARRHHAESLQ